VAIILGKRKNGKGTIIVRQSEYIQDLSSIPATKKIYIRILSWEYKF